MRLQDCRSAGFVTQAIQVGRFVLCGALLALSSVGAHAAITSIITQNQASGSAPFDPAPGCSQRGQDCSATDLRVRVYDTYTVRVSVATDAAGATGSAITLRYPLGAAYTASAVAAGDYASLVQPMYDVPSPSNCTGFFGFNDGTDAVVVCQLVAIPPNTTIDVNISIRTPVAVTEGTSMGLGSIDVTGAAGASLTRNDLPVTLTGALAPHGRKTPSRMFNSDMSYAAGSGPGGADGYLVTYVVERVFGEVSAKTQAGIAVAANLAFSFDDALFTVDPAVPAGTLLVSAANGFNVTGDAADGCFVEPLFAPANYSCDVTSTGPTGFSATTVPLTPADAKAVWPIMNGFVPNNRVTIRYWIPVASVTTDPTYLDNLATLTNGGADLDGVQWPDSVPYNPADVNDEHIGRATMQPFGAGGTLYKNFFLNLPLVNPGTTFVEYFAGYRDNHHFYFYMAGGADLHNVVMCDKIDNVFERLTGPAVFTLDDNYVPVPAGQMPAYTIDYGVGGLGGVGRTWATSGQPFTGAHADAGCADADSPVWFADPLNPPPGYSTGDITRVRLKLALLPFNANRHVDVQIPIEMSPVTPASNTGVALLAGTRDITQTAFTAGQPIPDGTVVYNYGLLTSDEFSTNRSDAVQVRQPKLLWGVNTYVRNANANGTALASPSLLGAGKALRFDVEWTMLFNNYYTGQETVTVTEVLSPQLSFQGTPPLPAGVSFTVEADQPFTGFTRLSWTMPTALAQFALDPTTFMPGTNPQGTLLRRAPFNLTYFATTNALAASQGLGLAVHATITSPNAWLDCRAALTLGNGTGQFDASITPDCPTFRGFVYTLQDATGNGDQDGYPVAGGQSLRLLTDGQAGFQIAKSLSVAGAPIGGFPLNTPFTFDIQWANTDIATPVLADVRLLDVLPYIGDAANPPGVFTGSYRLQSLSFDSNATGSTAYYTRAVPASVNVDPYHSTNAIPGGSTVWCTAAQFGSGGCPANIGAATAVLLVSTPIATGTLYSAQMVIAPTGNPMTDVYTNRAYGRPASLNLVSDDAFAAFAAPVLSVTKTLTAESIASNGIASPGETLTYTLTVTNSGTAPGTATVYEVVPQYTTYAGGSLPCAANAPAGTACTMATANIAAGASATFTFSVLVDSPLPTSATVVANRVALGNPPASSPTCSPNAATVCTPIEAAAFTVTKILTAQTVQNAVADPGETLTYTVTVANTGNWARSTTVYEIVPQHTTWVGGSITCGNNAAGSTCSVSTGVIAPGGSRTFSFSVRVDSPLAAGVARIANITAIDAPPQPIGDGSPCVAGPAVVCTPVAPPRFAPIPTLEAAGLALLALLLGGLAAGDLRRRR